MIRSYCFEFGLYGIRPCGSRTRPVRDIVDGYPPPVWAGGGRIVRVTISDCKSASRRPIEKLRLPNVVLREGKQSAGYDHNLSPEAKVGSNIVR